MNSSVSSLASLTRSIFRNGSITYYYSSIFFPSDVRSDVFILYAFVRTADDFVDSVPQQKTGFDTFCKETEAVFKGNTSIPVEDPVITAFYDMCIRRNIPYQYVDDFLKVMKQDLHKNRYKTYAQLEAYMYGSAEVVGLMMAHILHLPKESYPFAQKMGRAMQLINFIRDLREDNQMNRVYLPIDEQKAFSVDVLDDISAKNERMSNRYNMISFIHFEINRFYKLLSDAERGYDFIPLGYRIPIKTAADMYRWTAQRIETDPDRIARGSVKPSPFRVVFRLFVNYITL